MENLVSENIHKVKYDALRVLWKLFIPYGFLLTISLVVITRVIERLSFENLIYKDWFILFLFSFLFAVSIIMLLELVLLKEFRFYKDKLEKEWYFFGTKTVYYKDIVLRVFIISIASILSFNYLQKKWNHYKCCSLDLNLLNNKQRKDLLEFLAEVSGNSITEFEKTTTLIPFIKK